MKRLVQVKLDDDLVDEIDILAIRKGTKRAALMNDLLASALHDQQVFDAINTGIAVEK